MNPSKNRIDTNVLITKHGDDFDISELLKHSIDGYRSSISSDGGYTKLASSLCTKDQIIGIFNIPDDDIWQTNSNGEGFHILNVLHKNKTSYRNRDDGHIYGHLKAVYNKESSLFNIDHREVKDISCLGGTQMFYILEKFIKGLNYGSFGFELYCRQQQTLNWAKKIGFKVDLEGTNDLGRTYLKNPSSKEIKSIAGDIVHNDGEDDLSWLIEETKAGISTPSKGLLVSRDYHEEEYNIFTNSNDQNLVTIKLIKNF